MIDPWKCCRCGHEWYGRNPNEKPERCAGCKAPYWDRPARIKKDKPAPGCIGSASKYGFDMLEVGGSKLVLWQTEEQLRAATRKDDRQMMIDRAKILPAAKAYARRKGWTISTTPLTKGLLITRLA